MLHPRTFLTFCAVSCSLFSGIADCQQTVGPIVGTVESTTANILYRPGETTSKLTLSVLENGGVVQKVVAIAAPEHDFVAKFRLQGLKPDTAYGYIIESPDGRVLVPENGQHTFKTASLNRKSGRVSASFVSCVDIEPNGIWNDMSRIGVNALFLMGDTPYIDRSDLKSVRERHRKFLQMPELSALAARTPTMGTWDDHDFGRNNGNGRNMMKGKANTRRGFVEYRAHDQYGNGDQGVYHNVDLGMMEVFLLDPRFFSQTEPSPVDPTQPTCFGADQWQWLLDGLRESKAPFKVLAMGAIWQDKKNRETDDMFTYWYERDAILNVIKSERISGVVLLGGDIHVARHLVHPRRVGYDLHDFVISPGHTRVITELDVFHPSLEWSLVEGWQFLALTADGTGGEPKLIAEFRQPDAVINRKVEIPLSAMTPVSTKPSRELRAHWSFDDDFTNDSPLGQRIDAQSHHGASIVPDGVAGNAVQFVGDQTQFLSVPRSFLNDNSVAHTVSLWFKPESLPKHGTEQRAFLLESTAEGQPSTTSAWHLSLGLRAAGDPNTVNLQLYTHTLKPADQPEQAPTAVSQGPFDTLIDRDKLVKQWNHVAFTFDGNALTLFLNGQQVAKHTLPVPGPASEFGGLVIGGHRAGTGRNFDGVIDEVSVWQGLLPHSELKALFEQHQSK